MAYDVFLNIGVYARDVETEEAAKWKAAGMIKAMSYAQLIEHMTLKPVPKE
jgi:hypothetical protein